MQRMVECKYYLSINNVIDRSICYETTTEARRAAKSVKDGKVMIVAVMLISLDFFQYLEGVVVISCASSRMKFKYIRAIFPQFFKQLSIFPAFN